MHTTITEVTAVAATIVCVLFGKLKVMPAPKLITVGAMLPKPKNPLDSAKKKKKINTKDNKILAAVLFGSLKKPKIKGIEAITKPNNNPTNKFAPKFSPPAIIIPGLNKFTIK